MSKEAYLKDLDLSYLAKRLIEKDGWLQEDAYESVRRYKNFLMIRIKYPDVGVVPTSDIDEVWHTHILYTREYTRDCKMLFGEYLHHSPAGDDEKEKVLIIYHQTAKLYQKEFQESYSLMLDISTFW